MPAHKGYKTQNSSPLSTLPNFSPLHHNTFLCQITGNGEELAAFSPPEHISSKHLFTLTLDHDEPTQYREAFHMLQMHVAFHLGAPAQR